MQKIDLLDDSPGALDRLGCQQRQSLPKSTELFSCKADEVLGVKLIVRNHR